MNLVKNKKNSITDKITNKMGLGQPTLTSKVKNIADTAVKTASNLGDKVGKTVSDIKQNIQNKVSNTTEKVKATSTTKEATKAVGIVQEFMQANSAISKFVAIVLSILVFYMLFNVGVYFMSQFFMPAKNAKVVDGLIPSNTQIVVSANPNITSAVPILRSINQNQGLEFTWNLWYFIKDVTSLSGNGLIFSKGLAQKGKSTQNPFLGVCPGAYITKVGDQVQMIVAMNTIVDPSLNNTGVEQMVIKEIPMNKWVHCAIRVQNMSVDVYINGVMTQRKNLQTLPKQNYYDTYVGDPNGFNGYISSLHYYAHALNYDEIQNDFAKGPNMTLQGQSNQINYKDYLAMKWYYN
jgi:ElaB/YqjD/DUF883 family membrane-anchored ribosome-binding protein